MTPVPLPEQRTGLAVAAVAAGAVLLHWGVAQLENAAPAAWLHGAVTLAALSLVWFILVSPHEKAAHKPPANNLLQEIRPRFDDCLESVGGDIERVRALLSDAIRELLDSFDGMQRLLRQHAGPEHADAVSRLHEALLGARRSVDGLALPDDEVRRIIGHLETARLLAQQLSRPRDAGAPEPDAAVGKAVMSLQFQDMVDQLLLHSLRTLDGVRDALRRMEELDRQERSGQAPGSAGSEDARRQIADLLGHPDAAGRNPPVRQERMQGGDAELF